MKSAEEAAFARGVQAEDLMEQAGRGVAEIVRQFHPKPGLCSVFCGKGHNAGDALVAARYLSGWGWELDLRFAYPAASLSALAAKKLKQLPGIPKGSSVVNSKRIILDGLLGIGARGEPRGEIAESIRSLNRLRRDEGAWVLAIDIPSGLDGDTGLPASNCVQADLTATIACVKTGLVADAATNVVGRLAIVPLEQLRSCDSGVWRMATSETLKGWLPARPFDLHKGDCGRVGIIAGSPGFTRRRSPLQRSGGPRRRGACHRSCKAGDGSIIGDLLLSRKSWSSPWGAIVRCMSMRFDSLAIGPGLGLEHAGEVLAVMREAAQPMVVDADALNALSRDVTILRDCAGPRLLTPHPGRWNVCIRKRAEYASNGWMIFWLLGIP